MNLRCLLKGDVSLDELLNYYDTNITNVRLPKRINGFVLYYRGIHSIFIDSGLSLKRQKETILHELAHVELNQLAQYNKDLFSTKIEGYEDEADRYIELIKIEIEIEKNNETKESGMDIYG